jgi:2-polyprenyl-6-methoxyphenol hydroxylase-like FAD-dependent oxidoreductase
MTSTDAKFSESFHGTPGTEPRILISGAGIAGLALGFWLRKIGMNPVVIDRVPGFQALGHFIGLKGNGVEVLRQMGLEKACRARELKFNHLNILTPQGQLIRRNTSEGYEQSFGGFIPIRRADLHDIIFQAVKEDLDIRYGLEIQALRENGDSVEVEFSNGSTGHFDFVFGADGIRSRTRKLFFGDTFEHSLGGWYIAMTANYDHGLEGDHLRSYMGSGQSVILWPTSSSTVSAVFYYGSGAQEPQGRDTPSVKRLLLQAYAGYHSDVTGLLNALDEQSYVFMDTISQVRMPSIVKGRVALLGDAAHCPTLLSGMGSSLALQGARILALKLAEHRDNPSRALVAYEAEITPIANRYVQGALRGKALLLDRRPWVATVRDLILRLVPKWALDRKIAKFYRAENLSGTKSQPLAPLTSAPSLELAGS